jgi:hypothetical protein
MHLAHAARMGWNQQKDDSDIPDGKARMRRELSAAFALCGRVLKLELKFAVQTDNQHNPMSSPANERGSRHLLTCFVS